MKTKLKIVFANTHEREVEVEARSRERIFRKMYMPVYAIGQSFIGVTYGIFDSAFPCTFFLLKGEGRWLSRWPLIVYFLLPPLHNSSIAYRDTFASYAHPSSSYAATWTFRVWNCSSTWVSVYCCSDLTFFSETNEGVLPRLQKRHAKKGSTKNLVALASFVHVSTYYLVPRTSPTPDEVIELEVQVHTTYGQWTTM